MWRSASANEAQLLEAGERRTQRTYRYGIGLVCVGATLNWLGFAQGHGYVDPLRYLGVACVISGSFCVCMAMCRWLGRPLAIQRVRIQEGGGGSGQNGSSEADVHVINLSIPMYMPEYREVTMKPPEYSDIVTGGSEPPSYNEAIKLQPNSLNLIYNDAQEKSPSCQIPLLSSSRGGGGGQESQNTLEPPEIVLCKGGSRTPPPAYSSGSSPPLTRSMSLPEPQISPQISSHAELHRMGSR